MDRVAVDLEVAKLKKEGIRKACEQVNAQASSMVMLCLQWGDLERHFDAVQEELEVRLEKLSERERRLDQEERRLCMLREEMRIVVADEGERERKVVPPGEGGDGSVDELPEEVESKREGEELALVERCIKRCREQLDLKRRELELVGVSLSEKSRELESREGDLIRVGFRLEFQQEELVRVDKYAQERRDEVRCAEKELGSLRDLIGVKEKELSRIRQSIDGCVRELEVKEGLLESIKQQIKEHKEELAAVIPLGKDLPNDPMLKNGELGSANSNVETGEDNEQPTMRKSIREDYVISSSKRERDGRIITLDRGCGITMSCPDAEFSDFEKLRSTFSANQFWACYDNDMMPRYYARIDKVFSPGFKLLISWLVALPQSQAEHDWSEKKLPIGCGYFAFGEAEETEDRLIFSHRIRSDAFSRGNLACCAVYPKEGETWAIFKDWDIRWSSHPEKHRPYRYDYVEILSDFDEDSGALVAYLCKVKGFLALFQRVDPGNAVSVVFHHILPFEKYRFSHQIPSFKMTGEERAGVPTDSFELDPAGLDPDDLRDETKGQVQKRQVVIGLTSQNLGRKSARNG